VPEMSSLPAPAAGAGGSAGDGGAGDRARTGIRAWVSQSGRVLMLMTPPAIVTAMTAAAVAPVLLPLLGVTAGVVSMTAGTIAIQAMLAQLGGLGGNYLADVLHDVAVRLRGEARVSGVSEETLRSMLGRRLDAELVGPRAAGLRTEITQLLRGVNGVDEALRAAYASDVPGLAAHIGREVTQLSRTVAEFAGLREQMLGSLTAIQRDSAFIRTAVQDQGDELRRLNMNITFLRREIVRGGPAAPPGPHSLGALPGLVPGPALAGRVLPYPGLPAFSETDADWFYGRDRLTALLVEELRERLRGSSPLMVVGASGAGKSSVLRAGLIPELDSGALAEPGSEAWPRMIMTPGQFPFRDLGLRLAQRADLAATMVLDELAADPARAGMIIRQGLLARGERQRHGVISTAPDLGAGGPGRETGRDRRLVLIIDQFEEVFTQCPDGAERKRFVDAICAAARGSSQDPPAALVVIGLRMSFAEQCTAHPELEPALRDPVIVGPMNVRELHDAIELPARRAGLTVEAGLAAVMLRDLGAVESPGNVAAATYDPGRLPLLAHALRETWERSGGSQLTITAYDAVGGIKNALASKADQVYGSFDADGQRVARQLLEHMVAVHADAEDTRRRIRRSVLVSELPLADAPAAGQILDRLEAERLVTADEDTVQFAHEALLRYWPALARWLQENRAWRQEQQRLTEHAREWAASGHHPDRLLHGAQLSAPGEMLTDARRAELGELETDFLHASQARQGRVERTRRTVVAVLAVLVILAGSLAVLAQASSRTARQQQAIAQSVGLVAQASEIQAVNPQTSLLLSLEAYRVSHSPEAISSLLSVQASFFTHRLASGAGPVNAVAYDPDPAADQLATAAQGNVVTLWDTRTRRRRAALHGKSPFYAVAFSPDGRLLAGAEKDGDTLVWSIPADRPVGTISGKPDPVNAVTFSPDGRELATAQDGAVTLWRTAGLMFIRTLPVGNGPISSITFSHDDRRLAAACADHDVRVWELSRPAGTAPLVLRGHTGLVLAVAFSPDGTLASGGDDGAVRLWNVQSGALLGVLNSGTAAVRTVAFSPDGQELASGGADDAVRLWNVRTQAQAGELTGPAAAVASVAFSPDGHTLASGDLDATIGLWSVPAPAPPGAGAIAVAGSGPGLTLATGSTSQAITLWDAGRNRSWSLPDAAALPGTTTAVPGPQAPASLAFSPDGKTLATPAGDDRVTLWSTVSRRKIGTLTAPGPIDAVAYQPAARSGGPELLAGGSTNGNIYLWVPGSSQPAQYINRQLAPVRALAFSRDGTLLAAGSDDNTTLLVRITNDGGRIRTSVLYQIGGEEPVTAVAFSPRGTTLAIAAGHDAQLWDISHPRRPSGPLTLPGATQAAMISVAFSSSGTMLAAAADDGAIRLWDVADPAAPIDAGTLAGLGNPTEVAFEPGRPVVVGAAADGTAVLWDIRPDVVASRICASHPHASAAALQPYLRGITYRPVCPAAR
jgi:WD40 repeat protein